MSDKTDAENVAEAIQVLFEAHGAWREKADAVRGALGEEVLDEFLSWFV